MQRAERSSEEELYQRVLPASQLQQVNRPLQRVWAPRSCHRSQYLAGNDTVCVLYMSNVSVACLCQYCNIA